MWFLILRKLKKLKGKARAEAMARIGDGEAPEDVSRPLVDTSQMRKSIISQFMPFPGLL